jgi:hypothetical protein
MRCKRIQSDTRKRLSRESCTSHFRHNTTSTNGHKDGIAVGSGQFHIETAFLYGKLEEDRWMVIPDGYQDYEKEKFNENIDSKTHCLKLTREIYGLVQAARQWWKKFKDVLSCIGYFPSRDDPCLFIRKALGQKLYLIIYVDDGGIFCKEKKK